jgi:glycosyltransferase involved in cell wall biosynthesis
MKILFEDSRILQVARGDARGIGGAERQQWLLARALAARGCDVLVYSAADGGEPDVEIEGVSFHGIRAARPESAWWRILRRERPDWWYVRGSDHTLGIKVPMAHRAGSRVVFAIAHDFDCTPRRALTRRKYLWFLYASGLKRADRILVQHEGQRGMLAPDLQARAVLVPSVAVVGENRRDRDDYVAWIASLRETKRPHLVAEIARRLPEVRFVVCGPPTRSYTSPGYADGILDVLGSCPNIDYRGRVSPVEAQRVIENSALFLSTAAAEGFPNTFLQAWGSGVPVVSLGLDPGDVIRRHAAGLLADGVEDAAACILDLLRDRERNSELGANGHAYVRERHDESAVAERLLSALA